MKKLLGLTTALLVLASAIPASAATPASAGGVCKKAGAKVTVYSSELPNRGVTYTCVKSGKKLVYNKGVAAIKVKSLLTISQVWKGNSVTVTLLDSLGNQCDTNIAGTDCSGFYIGWRASFHDTRSVTWGSNPNAEATISNLELGDNGAFRLMYQEVTGPGGSIPIVVKEFPFAYDY